MLNRRELLAGAGAAAALLACQKSRTSRTVQQLVAAQPSRDGAGVALRRSIGNSVLANLDPFLLLDEIHSSDPADYASGFPQHPHRGFETVSYVLRGGFEHRDNAGNHGLIADGGVQWMTAGHGILHSEMPRATTSSELWGLQLWVNLPAARKLIKPRYQNLEPSTVPEMMIGDAKVRVVAGQAANVRGPVDGIDIRPTMLDAALAPGAIFVHALPGGDTAFAYVLEGELQIEGARIAAGELAVLGPGDRLAVSSLNGGRMLLVSGTPLREPIARRGPFVMSTEAELQQAIRDYQSGHLTDPV